MDEPTPDSPTQTTWQVELTPQAIKSLKKLDKAPRNRIVRFLEERIQGAVDPTPLGTQLVDSDGLWRYRVGDYRILCLLERERVTVLVIEVAHRRQIYR